MPFTWHASSTTESFADVKFPGVLKDCETCHVPGTYDFSSTAATNALPNRLYRTVATGIFNGTAGTLTAGCTVTLINDCLATPVSVFSLSPYVIKDNVFNYGAGYSVAAGTGVPTNAAPTTLVNSPIATQCFSCHDTPLARTPHGGQRRLGLRAAIDRARDRRDVHGVPCERTDRRHQGDACEIVASGSDSHDRRRDRMSATRLALAALLALGRLVGAPDPQASSAQARALCARAPRRRARRRRRHRARGRGREYSEKGADTCLGCHDAEADTATFKVAGIFQTKHAQRGDKHAPFGPGGLQCEACHGPGDGHATGKGGKKTATINNFKASSFLSVEERNQPCLGCHAGRARTAWHASVHERAGLACTDCHRLHVERDAVITKADQPEVCLTCHRTQRADFQKNSTHPVRFGLMACSDCHNPHGSTTVAMLNKPTREPDLLQLPRRKARPDALGARAGGRGLHALPLRPRLGAHGAAEQEPAAALPAMPHGRGPSGRGPHRGGAARQWWRRLDLPDRGQLHQLPLAGPRFEPSRRSQADAVRS